ncbi:enoyl-CoA hydratase family protein [Actinacidiphila rubida]|uniref:Short chain enoyl-CoA hydratase /Enoyl-CoA hydratase n=1 Tax=Actinacidiphila rubida TaxID=310780 RepID=A0A1H8FVK5_9ACTN|nr:enoyl-CoA hydratase family protein [Actinacidiphila rubida]SEN35128.1 short chain enoyl-CoA hydratase /Enoyl-CoA hydratase [Actinacidiphila rubida]
MSPHPSSASPTGHWRHLRLDRSEGVATVTLDRPDRLNALTFGAYADLRDLLAELAREGDTRALVLGGAGRGFCSGGDVEEIIGATLAMSAGELLDFTRMTGQVVRAIREAPFPVIAAVHGVAAGAGAVLALASDFRIVEPGARFAFLFTRVGLAGADMGAAYLLPRLVGLGHATRLLMLGDAVDAAEAERIGLVSQTAPEGGAHAAAAALARKLADGPALAYRQTKALLTAELDMPLGAAVEMDAAAQALLMTSADYAEFHAAFTARREPEWEGR